MKSYFKFLSRNKAYTAIDVLGLALSMMFIIIIGAYTWQETHVDSQHSKADRMFLLGLDENGHGITGGHWRLIRKLVDQFPEIESGTAIVSNRRILRTSEGENVVTTVIYADSTFYDIFDFGLVRGDRHKVLSQPNSIVVTEEYARRVWHDEDPIGKTIIFNDEEDPLVVTGIMEPMENTAITSPVYLTDKTPVDAIIPFEMVKYFNLSLWSEGMNNAMGAEIVLLGREGSDLAANAGKYHDFAKEFFWILQLPDSNSRLTLVPFKEQYFSGYSSEILARGDAKMVKILFSVGVVILLFALMNYVNLTVALSGYRAKEMATRRLLGAWRGAIIRKLMAESTLLCAVSAAIGALLAWQAWPYAGKLLDTPLSFKSCLTPATAAIFAGIVLLMGVLAGIIPAMLISSAKPIDIVRGSFRRHTKMLFSKVFIVVQNVTTIAMIASAITMYLQIDHIVNAPLGYNTENIMEISNGGDQKQAKEFMRRVEQLAGVEAVAANCGTPVGGGNNNTMTYDGRTISFQTIFGDENFLKIYGIGIERDNHTSNPMKIYLNRQAISELGLDEDAESYPYYDRTETIAGIVSDFRIRTILDDQHPLRVIILDLVNTENENYTPWGFSIKVKGDPDETFGQVKAIFKDVFNLDYEDQLPYIHQQIEYHYHRERNISTIVSLFAAIAIMISLLGLVAMSTYFVEQRRREIAVKKVFGCESGEMLRKLVLSFMAYVGVAFAIAVPLVYYLMHTWLSDFSYRIDLYWWIYLVAGAACLAISVASVFVQSYRAANANPIKALNSL